MIVCAADPTHNTRHTSRPPTTDAAGEPQKELRESHKLHVSCMQVCIKRLSITLGSDLVSYHHEPAGDRNEAV